jgi:hypothetical protein
MFQLGRRCQINFIAADTFLGWVSFKGEREELLVVLYAKWDDSIAQNLLKHQKAIKWNLKFNQSRNAIQYFSEASFYGSLGVLKDQAKA